MDCADAKKLANMLPTKSHTNTVYLCVLVCVCVCSNMRLSTTYSGSSKNNCATPAKLTRPNLIVFFLSCCCCCCFFFVCTCYVRKFFENFWIFCLLSAKLAVLLLLRCCCGPAAKNMKLLTVCCFLLSFCNFYGFVVLWQMHSPGQHTNTHMYTLLTTLWPC